FPTPLPPPHCPLFPYTTLFRSAASPAFSLPDLDDVAAAVETSPVDERRLETVYYDTPDLRLARWGANLRIRQGEGWTLKLPSARSEEHTSELQSPDHLVCRLLL